ALAVAGVAYLVLKRRRYFGQVAGVVLIQYSITRAVIEMFRGDDVRGVWFGGAVSTSQIIAVFGVLAGLAILATARRRPLPASLAP
ncbi:MAG TPA: prolipoprotein diacylglyceryl transferase family protein, partial [Planctomycetota bacterium]|nr:prolipoprotein diacylglyceryl transferase family protein [Planctomycetota bacterium]